MKKVIALLTVIALTLVFVGCSSNKSTETTAEKETTVQHEKQSDENAADKNAAGGKPLVVYFSATGTTKGVAQQIASVTGADTYEIVPAQPYSEADLDWHDSGSRTTIEQNDKSTRPEIGSEKINLDNYSTIYIGFPIWWGEEPRIMDTFVESYDFSGKTVIPFCTSGGSGIGASGSNLASNAGTGNWLEGERLSSESDIEGWINGLKK